MMKNISNYISVSRMFLAFTLLFTKPLSVNFFVIYCLCGVSDILDGYIARKTNTVSKIGGKLDSMGDFIMIVFEIIVLYPVINLEKTVTIWIFIIACIKILAIIIALFKFRELYEPHTYANKFTGILLFLYPMSFLLEQSFVYTYILCVIATVSAMEELLINIISSKMEMDIRSILDFVLYK